jgi:hypothetical protein
MVGRNTRRAAFAAAALMLAANAAPATLAQEYPSSTITTGGVAADGHRGSISVAPSVIISGGNVSNTTGIGVNVGGGSSIGTTTGGDDSAAIVQ